MGRVWLHARDAESALARYSKLLFCLNHSDDHPYTLRGTATALRLKGQCLLFFCRHQYHGYDANDVVIATDKTATTLVSGGTLVTVNITDQNRDEEYPDVCAARFDIEKYNTPNMEHQFFDVIKTDCWRPADIQTHFLVLGYPSHYHAVDYDIPHIDVKQVSVGGKYVSTTSAEGLHRLKMERTSDFSADGLSGCPVFHLSEGRDGFYIGIAGIVLRGSDTSDFLHFIDARYLLQFFTA